MSSPHSNLNDYEYWDLRLRLFELQKDLAVDIATYEEMKPGLEETKRDLVEDLYNYLITEAKERDPWN